MESPSDSEVTLRSSSRSRAGTNRHHWNNFVFIARALKLQCMRSCPLSPVPPAVCGDPDELPLFLCAEGVQRLVRAQ